VPHALQGGSVYGTPRQSIRSSTGHLLSVSGSAKDLTEDALESPFPEPDQRQRPPIAGRRNLRNFTFQRPRTDFETWAQAENALQHGVTVKELVRREFHQTLGPSAVR
jgi:hypothetical protein